MLRKGVCGVILFCALSVNAVAATSVETNSTKNDMNVSKIKKSVKKKEELKTSLQEAEKLLDEINLEKVYKAAVNNSTYRLIRANSKFKKVEGKIRSFYQKYIGWDSMKKDLAKLYAKYYTAQELRDIAAFYKTKTGKKVLATMGKLTYEGQMITRKKLEPHIAELRKILDSAMKDDTSSNTRKGKKENPGVSNDNKHK